MSLLNYFKRNNNDGSNFSTYSLPTPEESGLTREAISAINDNLASKPPKKKRANYTPKEKALIGRYAIRHTIPKTVRKFQTEFPNLNYPTVKRMKIAYEEQSKLFDSCYLDEVQIKKRGRPFNLPDQLQSDLERWMVRAREAGCSMNVHVINSALLGIIQSDPMYSVYSNFTPTRGWRVALYKRLNMTRRRATTSRPPISSAAYKESALKYLHNICHAVRTHKIPDDLIVTIDQTPSKYVEVSSTTMAEKNTKHVAVTHSGDKRAITLTLGISLSGDILPYQMIYGGKTQRCLPDKNIFPENFLLSFNPSHWSNEVETKKLIKEILVPYFDSMKKALKLPDCQKCLLIWDDFKAHSCKSVHELLGTVNIVTADIPKNMTHLLSPLDLTVNNKMKAIEREDFSNYYSAAMTKILSSNKEIDIADARVDIKMSTLKPIHARSIARSYSYFKSDHGRRIIASGWRAAGITGAVKKCREDTYESLLNPFSHLNLNV